MYRLYLLFLFFYLFLNCFYQFFFCCLVFSLFEVKLVAEMLMQNVAGGGVRLRLIDIPTHYTIIIIIILL